MYSFLDPPPLHVVPEKLSQGLGVVERKDARPVVGPRGGLKILSGPPFYYFAQTHLFVGEALADIPYIRTVKKRLSLLQRVSMLHEYLTWRIYTKARKDKNDRNRMSGAKQVQ